MTSFRDRVDAGRHLVLPLAHLGAESPIVLALPRGGVPVAFEIASSLRAPLDVLVTRKLGAPGNPELGFGAIAEGGVSYVDGRIVAQLGVSVREIARIESTELAELERRARLYRGDRPALDVRGRTVILVDDGLATGVSARAAIRSLRARSPARIVFAAPVCAAETAEALGNEVDELVCAASPSALFAVGIWYDDFTQTSDHEVLSLLERARWDEPQPGVSKRPSESRMRQAACDRTIQITWGTATLEGALSVPDNATGIVLFAHGSGSSRHSPRNRYVAGELQRAGFGTLLLDLLSAEEEAEDELTRSFRFDIPRLAQRVVAAIDWLTAEVPYLPIALFGASTGAAAAIVAATHRPDRIRAIVARGGRPDLAGAALEHLRVPTLLIVGSADVDVLRLHRETLPKMNGYGRLVLVPGATHLFEEPGALTQVAMLAQRWLIGHLGDQGRRSRKETA